MKKKHYTGGKGGDGVYHFIINKMPKHDIYIETHLGGGSIFLKKKPAHANILIEKSTQVLEDFARINKKDCSVGYVNNDCMWFLNQYRFTNKELLFVDPPYLMDTRKGTKRSRYEFEYKESDHIELLTFLNTLKCFVMITAYESKLYNNLLSDWHIFKFKAMTRGGQVEETLYCNFNPDDYMKHDYSYCGSTALDRVKLKRKATRWIDRLKEQPKDEREYLINQLTINFKEEIKHFL